MGFSQAVSRGLTQYATFKGRASRSEYWWFILFCVLCCIPGVLVTIALEFPVVAFVWLGLVVPTVSVFVRRMHDTGRAGTWWLLAFVPFGAFVLLVFLCQGGDPDLNGYGPPPVVEPGVWDGV